MSEDRLVVRHFGREVGTLTRTAQGTIAFEYADSWRQRGFALSVGLPLVEGQQETTYFRNLLPEAGARERIAAKAGLSPQNDFAFLKLFGADCAGAFEITPAQESKAQKPPQPGALLPLTEEDGVTLATRAGFASFFSPSHRVRLSLAGAQNKLGVVKTAAGLAIPLDGRPSTHILKLPNPDYKGLIENEAAMLTVAKSVGLDVVEHEVITLGKTRLLLIQRYDRAISETGTVTRLHQQDLCQVMGLPPELKYEREGGPSLQQVFEHVRDTVEDPLGAAISMLNWVAFNVLVHNADAHAKNISILRTQDGQQQLAPFYDLLCTGTYDLDHTLAMAIGGQLDPGAIGKKNWVQFAADIGVGKTLVLKTVQEMASRLPSALDETLQMLSDTWGIFPRQQQLERTIARRVKKTLSLL